MAKLKYPG